MFRIIRECSVEADFDGGFAGLPKDGRVTPHFLFHRSDDDGDYLTPQARRADGPRDLTEIFAS